MSERDINRFAGADGKLPLSAHGQPLPNSKSVPALHHAGGNMSEWWKHCVLVFVERNIHFFLFLLFSIGRPIADIANNNKSRSIHNLTGNSDQSFYQNLSVYRAQNQSQPNLGDRYVKFEVEIWELLSPSCCEFFFLIIVFQLISVDLSSYLLSRQ